MNYEPDGIKFGENGEFIHADFTCAMCGCFLKATESEMTYYATAQHPPVCCKCADIPTPTRRDLR